LLKISISRNRPQPHIFGVMKRAYNCTTGNHFCLLLIKIDICSSVSFFASAHALKNDTAFQSNLKTVIMLHGIQMPLVEIQLFVPISILNAKLKPGAEARVDEGGGGCSEGANRVAG
jgi:hypothetical protein